MNHLCRYTCRTTTDAVASPLRPRSTSVRKPYRHAAGAVRPRVRKHRI